MRYYAGLDVSIKGTSICIVDDEGRMVREAKVVTEPAAIVAELTRCGIVYGPLASRPDRCRNGFMVR
jgi:transposase